VNVLPTNQKPSIVKSFSEQDIVQVKENEKLDFWVDVNDDNKKDSLAYRWELDTKVISKSSEGAFVFNYEAAGEHTIKVTINDGELQETREWIIKVENVNRAPVLALIPATVREGELVNLSLPQKDLDGDVVIYSFETPLNEQGLWQTGFEDAGKYKIKVSASDGLLRTEEKVEIIVLEVDRAPQLQAPLKVDVREGELLTIPITFVDPDDDEVAVAFQDLPEGVKFDKENKTLQWTPSYNTIHRRGGMLSNMLNVLRLEKFFIRQKTASFTITACGKDLCTSQPVEITIHNVNQAPVFSNLQNITVKEMDTIEFQPEAVDIDGDIIRYYFTKPLGVRNGKWATTINSEGTYTTYVTAYDGQDEITTPVKITVKKKNREPTLKIRDDEVTVNEGHLFSIRVNAVDLDNDTLEIGLKNPPSGASFNEGLFLWEPGFDRVMNASRSWKDSLFRRSPFLNKKLNENKKVVWLEFTASDGESEMIHPVKVTLKNVNQAPQLLDYIPATETITVKTNEPVLFHVAVKDVDGDLLQYEWDFGFGQKEVTGTSTIRRTFLTPGTKMVEVSVSDGVEEIEKKWMVNVQEEVYMPPVLPTIKPVPPKFKVYVIRS
ncbi:MAG: Ig-like domain-containing protein, partial [Nanoarchaeota archaeon]|nr:Ig-like domain-containing protein [Nanoarchaeota archaeon]